MPSVFLMHHLSVNQGQRFVFSIGGAKSSCPKILGGRNNIFAPPSKLLGGAKKISIFKYKTDFLKYPLVRRQDFDDLFFFFFFFFFLKFFWYLFILDGRNY